MIAPILFFIAILLAVIATILHPIRERIQTFQMKNQENVYDEEFECDSIEYIFDDPWYEYELDGDFSTNGPQWITEKNHFGGITLEENA